MQAQTWRSIYVGRQRATEEVIFALCENWPKYAYSLGTGTTDEDHDYSSPTLERGEGVIARCCAVPGSFD